MRGTLIAYDSTTLAWIVRKNTTAVAHTVMAVVVATVQ